MLFADHKGKIMLSEEVDELSPWEIEDRELHIYDDEDENG